MYFNKDERMKARVSKNRGAAVDFPVEKIRLLSIVRAFYINVGFFALLLIVAGMEKNDTVTSLLMAVSTTISYTMVFLWFISQCRYCGIRMSQVYPKRKNSIFFVVLIFYQLANFFVFIPFFGGPERMMASAVSVPESSAIVESGSIMILINYFMLIPVVEELVYRFVLYNKVKIRFGIKWAIIISSAVFALFHIMNGWENIAYSTFLGIFYAVIYEYTGSIKTTTFLHITNNVLVFVLSAAPKRIIDMLFFNSTAVFLFSASSLTSFAGMLFLIWFFGNYLVKIRKSFHLNG